MLHLRIGSTIIVGLYVLMIVVSLLLGSSVKLEAPPNVPIPASGRAFIEQPTGEGPFSFIVVGDTRRGTRWFQVMMEKAARRRPAFVVLLGDFANRPTLDEYRFFFKVIEETGMQIPLVMAAGNHDIEYHGRIDKEIYRRFFKGPYYYFTYSDSLFVILDGSMRDIDEPQFKWLEEVLAKEAPEHRHVLLFSHVPPIPLDFPDCRCMAESTRSRLEGLIKKYRVDMFVSAHLHNYYRTTREGTVYLVTGGGGAPLQKFLGGDGFHHMVEVKVSPAGLQDDVISVRGVSNWTEAVDYFLVARLFPLILRHIYFFMAQLAAGILFVFLQVSAMVRDKRL